MKLVAWKAGWPLKSKSKNNMGETWHVGFENDVNLLRECVVLTRNWVCVKNE
jgi:hypothetical protein